MRLTDAHAHLNEPILAGFVSGLRGADGPRVVTNSVDVDSSRYNIEISKSSDLLIPFVGIHPEIFANRENADLSKERLNGLVGDISGLIKNARGIGEVGLDPKYGHLDKQEYLLNGMLSLAESSGLPLVFHCRDAATKIMDKLASYNLRQKIMFHWFAGSTTELQELHDRGIFTSFGPSILFSRRMAGLVSSSDTRFLLAETDSPTTFQSILDGPSTPFLVYSVAFKIGSILKMPFEDVCDLIEINAEKYLVTQD